MVNLADLPFLILTGEASYHAPYDHCTSAFLDRAGVPHDFVPCRTAASPATAT